MKESSKVAGMVVGSAFAAGLVLYGLVRCIGSTSDRCDDDVLPQAQPRRDSGDSHVDTKSVVSAESDDAFAVAAARSETENEDESSEEHQHGTETELVASATESDDVPDVDPTPTAAPSEKKRHLNKKETWTRARYLFPGLKRQLLYRRARDPDIKDILQDSLSLALKQLHQQDEEDFARLMKRENAVELCITLGMNETVVQKRYEVIDNLQRELHVESKTSTVDSIRHLIYRLDANNPYRMEEDFDSGILETYKGKTWLSYFGVNVARNEPKKALQSIQDTLTTADYLDRFMHGTCGKHLQGLEDSHGLFRLSEGKQDFDKGIYCFKGDPKTPLKQFLWALSFAIDRCWPTFDENGNAELEEGDGGLLPFTMHNPAIVLFPDDEVSRAGRAKKNQMIYQVGKHHPFPDKKELQRKLRGANFAIFDNARNGWKEKSDDRKKWKEFVKLARYYGKVPGGYPIFKGWLHDTEKTGLTDADEKAEPVIDKDLWEQYCFQEQEYLGEKTLFIELNVNWSEWVGEVAPESSREEIEGAVKVGMDALSQALDLKKVRKQR